MGGGLRQRPRTPARSRRIGLSATPAPGTVVPGAVVTFRDASGDDTLIEQQDLDIGLYGNYLLTGKVVGDIPQNVNFAIRASTLSNFLEANQVSYEVAPKAEALPSTKVAEKALAASVQLVCMK